MIYIENDSSYSYIENAPALKTAENIPTPEMLKNNGDDCLCWLLCSQDIFVCIKRVVLFDVKCNGVFKSSNFAKCRQPSE